MYSTATAAPTLAARFARNTRTAYALRREEPLSEDQMRTVAPSIFAEGKHASRSERYTYPHHPGASSRATPRSGNLA